MAREEERTVRQLARLIVESSLEGVWVIGRDGRTTFVNERLARMLGRPVEGLLGVSPLDLSAPESRAALAGCLAAAPPSTPGPVEVRFVRADAGLLWAAVSASPIPGDAGGHAGTLAMVLDVTDRKASAVELERQRAFLRQVIDINPSFIFAKDRAGRFTLVNAATAEAYGTTVEGLLGKTDADFNPNAAEVEFFRRMDLEVMDTLEERFIPEEVVTDSKGARRWLQTVKRPIVGDDGRANQVLGVATDITRRKLAEAALLRTEEQLRQAQKLEAIGRLAGGLAHDFNNVLTVVLGHAARTLARLAPGGNEEARAALEGIRGAAESAASLTRQLLAFGRRQVLEPRVLDLNAVVERIAGMIRRLIGDDVELVTALDPGLFRVRVDPGQLEQVVFNLAVNARDAMPRGGRLTIETANVAIDAEEAREHGADVGPGPYAALVVSDTGTGMDAATLARAFEPFFTTKEPGKGTGLGLATAYGIVKQSGGHIAVSSRPGEGATFRVYLPRAEEEPGRGRGAGTGTGTGASASTGTTASTGTCASASASPGAGARGTVLLVEDYAPLRDLARVVLEDEGYAVLAAASPLEALRIAGEERTGPIDIIVTDVIMPDMSGPALADELARRRPEARVLYMTAHAEALVDDRAGATPRGPLIRKPFAPEALVAKVREVLDAGAPGASG